MSGSSRRRPGARLADFSEERIQRRLNGQMGYLAPFTLNHRAFQFYAVLGSGAATRGVEAINGILASCRVGGPQQ